MESDMKMTTSLYALASGFYIIGVLVSAVFLINFVFGTVRLIRLYVWPRIFTNMDYVTMYGKWAVITGGSDGIGKAYAMELAQRGMNILILSNRENGVVSEIKKEYGNVEVRHLEVDFSSTDIYEQVEKEISLLDDIGILINNVGMLQSKWEPLVEQKREFLKTIMNVNMTSMVLMTEIVLRKMMINNRGLIVNMCSFSTIFLLPYASMYSSTKAFVENYSLCLGAELNEVNVHVKCMQPCFVRTQILKDMNKLTDFLSNHYILNVTFLDAKTFAASAVATFGCVTPIQYTGYWSHEILRALAMFAYLGKERTAATMKSIIRWITNEV